MFDSIDVSEYTKVVITAYNAIDDSEVETYEIDGPTTQKNFGYQIPVQENIPLYIEVKVISEGQVNDGQKQIDAGKTELETQRKVAYAQLADAQGTLNQKQAELLNGKIELIDTIDSLNSLVRQVRLLTEVLLSKNLIPNDYQTDQLLAYLH